MSIAQILAIDYDAEIANTRRTLERIPENDPQWKPAEKSMPIGRLSAHVARLPEFWSIIATKPELNFSTFKMPPLVFESTAQILSDLERTSKQGKEDLFALTDDQLQENWKLLWGDKLIVEAPRVLLYRTMFMNHLVHHRAQLGVYLRLLNVPVPGLYGPSADEPM